MLIVQEALGSNPSTICNGHASVIPVSGNKGRRIDLRVKSPAEQFIFSYI